MSYKEEKYIDLDGQELTKKTFSDGTIRFGHINDRAHRLDGPARIWPNGEEEYWLEGEKVSRKEIDLLWLKKQVE